MPALASLPPAYAFRYTSSYFRLRHSRSMNRLSVYRPLPSMLILTPYCSRRPVKTWLVNCASLVGIEHFWHPLSESLFQGFDTEVGLPSVGQPPGQHIAAIPTHDGHQIQEASGHGDVGNVCTPDLVGLGNFYTP